MMGATAASLRLNMRAELRQVKQTATHADQETCKILVRQYEYTAAFPACQARQRPSYACTSQVSSTCGKVCALHLFTKPTAGACTPCKDISSGLSESQGVPRV